VFWITPHTFAHTNLQQAKTGDIVNLEADLLAKYAARFAGGSK
jgi:riboflavin synthase